MFSGVGGVISGVSRLFSEKNAHSRVFGGSEISVRGFVPNIRGLMPNVRGLMPDIRGIVPNVRGFPPNVRDFVPSLRGFVPNVRGYVPNVRAFVPKTRGLMPGISEWTWDVVLLPAEMGRLVGGFAL